jgi:hypothetical protein
VRAASRACVRWALTQLAHVLHKEFETVAAADGWDEQRRANAASGEHDEIRITAWRCHSVRSQFCTDTILSCSGDGDCVLSAAIASIAAVSLCALCFR